MNDKDRAARERIITAMTALLSEGADPASVTVRQIAERANVSLGSINYYFQSKDNLLNEAVGALMMQEAGAWLQPAQDVGADPVIRLKNLLKETSRIGARFPRLLQVAVTHEIQHGNFGTALMIVPLLREVFGAEKTEMDLRLIALQMLVPLQVASLRVAAFQMYAGIDVLDERQRDAMIDTLIDNLIGG